MKNAGTEEASGPADAWAERAAERSPVMQQHRSRNVRHMKGMVEAAKRLIARNGSGFTTQELVREANVAQQTFYRYFTGKDHLLIATMEDLNTTYAASAAEAARDLPDPLLRLRYYIDSSLAYLDTAAPDRRPARYLINEHWRLHQLYPDEMALVAQPIVELFAREMHAATEEGLIAPSDTDQSAEMLIVLVRAAFHHYAFQKNPEPTAVIANRVWEMSLLGIGGQAAPPAELKKGDPSASPG